MRSLKLEGSPGTAGEEREDAGGTLMHVVKGICGEGKERVVAGKESGGRVLQLPGHPQRGYRLFQSRRCRDPMFRGRT